MAEPAPGWAEQDVPYTEGEIAAISAADSETAWASPISTEMNEPGKMGVIRTEDGGSEWFIQSLEYVYGWGFPDVYSVDKNTAWAILGGGIYKTIDGGVTWEWVNSLQGMSFAQHIAAPDAETASYVVWGSGFWGTYYSWAVNLTIDAGANWDYWSPEYLAPSCFEDISTADAADDSTLWVSFLAGLPDVSWPFQVMARSSDEGATWEINELYGYGIQDICALDSLNAWAVGNDQLTSYPGTGSGIILKTADGGATWEEQYVAEGHSLSAISAVDDHTAWAVGEVNNSNVAADAGIILKTTDGGATWTTQYEFSGGYFNDVCAVDASTAWACGKSATGAPLMLKTVNGGEPIPLSVTSIVPERGVQHTLFLDITDLSGTNFKPGATVRLEKGEKVLNAYNVSVVSPTQITCGISLFGAEPGVYDVVVVNPDGTEARLPAGFTVDALCGAGSGTALLMLGLTLGLLSLAGTVRHNRKKKH